MYGIKKKNQPGKGGKGKLPSGKQWYRSHLQAIGCLLLSGSLIISSSLLLSGCGQKKTDGNSQVESSGAEILKDKNAPGNAGQTGKNQPEETGDIGKQTEEYGEAKENQPGESQVGKDEAEAISQTGAYRTDTVKRGTFTKSSNFDGMVYYPELSQVTYEGEEAVLTEWLVEMGSKVKEGDPLAYIQIEYDEVALQEQELGLERLESDYEWQHDQMEEALAEKRKRASGASSQSREAIEYRKAEKELELYELSMGQQIEAKRKSVQEWKDRISVTTISAPRDGVVSDLIYLKSGEVVPQGESLMAIYNPEVIWLQVSDPNASLRYQMEVSIETGTPKNRVSMTGEVVAADNILPDALRRGIAFIELAELPERVTWSNTSIRANLISMEEVLLVSRMAVESDTGGSFVYLLEDGTLHKRQVIRAGQGTEATWIFAGLEEGQEVVISGVK